ncbi:MAG: OFA family MFS transporter [Verrucomicrobiaceae bacterium]|nr:OFA family MFS transporter [Verrucomicrobiaceae bacterium]
MSILSREATVAGPGFSRWMVPPAALAVHMCIGQVYAFSTFNIPLAGEFGVDKSTFSWAYSIGLIMLGLSAAVFGKWVERSGPRKTMLASAACFCGGLALAGLFVKMKLLWPMLLAYGFIGGIGLGLGYIAPVSTLVKWFPDRPGMATGMAIMGFGSGAMIGGPLSVMLMKHFAPSETMMIMALIYVCFMIFGAIIVRVPAEGWKPAGWEAGPKAASAVQVSVDVAWKTPQFWLLWVVLCMNVSAGIGILGRASDMLQDMFHLTGEEGAAIGGGFVGLISLFNMGGRFLWSSASDLTGRKTVYCIYFILGAILYSLLPMAQEAQSRLVFVLIACVIISMYGGGFATIPAYLKDTFGTYQVGAIHGRLITAWSAAAVIGPLLINKLSDAAKAAGVPKDQAYNGTLRLMCLLLAVGLVANLLMKPVAEKYHLKLYAEDKK